MEGRRKKRDKLAVAVGRKWKMSWGRRDKKQKHTFWRKESIFRLLESMDKGAVKNLSVMSVVGLQQESNSV